MKALAQIDRWGARHAAAAVVRSSADAVSHGDPDHRFRLASVTKLLTAYATFVAVAEGSVGLDQPAGPPGSTLRHLIAHASGLGFEGAAPLSRPGATRIYSNPGFDTLAGHVAERTGVSFDGWLHDRVLAPLGMRATTLLERPSQGAWGPLTDLVAFAAELLRPTLIPPALLDQATRVVFPGLAGVLPGVGRFDPLDWGLGFELRGMKSAHWTGRRNSPATFGHFGGSGTFLWVDPEAELALVCLTDREYGPWALEAWPVLADDVLVQASP
jgi:CubicO group peptidase (beta-lactamase class C family)